MADLSAVSTSALANELGARGFELTVASAWTTIVVDLEERTRKAEARAAAAEEKVAQAVCLGFDALTQRTKAEVDAHRAEENVSVLARAFVDEEFPDHTGD